MSNRSPSNNKEHSRSETAEAIAAKRRRYDYIFYSLQKLESGIGGQLSTRSTAGSQLSEKNPPSITSQFATVVSPEYNSNSYTHDFITGTQVAYVEPNTTQDYVANKIAEDSTNYSQRQPFESSSTNNPAHGAAYEQSRSIAEAQLELDKIFFEASKREES